jgi:hypothetical protein
MLLSFSCLHNSGSRRFEKSFPSPASKRTPTVTELRQNLQPFTNRVRFTWLNELSFEEMRKRLAALPSVSAILYAVLLVEETV